MQPKIVTSLLPVEERAVVGPLLRVGVGLLPPHIGLPLFEEHVARHHVLQDGGDGREERGFSVVVENVVVADTLGVQLIEAIVRHSEGFSIEEESLHLLGSHLGSEFKRSKIAFFVCHISKNCGYTAEASVTISRALSAMVCCFSA